MDFKGCFGIVVVLPLLTSGFRVLTQVSCGTSTPIQAFFCILSGLENWLFVWRLLFKQSTHVSALQVKTDKYESNTVFEKLLK